MSDSGEVETAIASSREQLGLLHREIDFQRQSFTTRYTNLSSRAVVLIGSASVTSALHITQKPTAAETVAVGAAMLAALLGILTLIPRSGREVNVTAMRDDLFTVSPGMTEMNLLNAKIRVLGEDEKALKLRSVAQIVGYLLLAAAIFLVMYQSIHSTH